MKAIIDELIAKLTEFRKADADLDAIEAQHSAMVDQVEVLKDTLIQVKDDLASAQSGLTSHQKDNLKKYQENVFNLTKELEALNAAVRDARTRLETVNVEIESATTKHRQIEDSLANLRRQHFG